MSHSRQKRKARAEAERAEAETRAEVEAQAEAQTEAEPVAEVDAETAAETDAVAELEAEAVAELEAAAEEQAEEIAEEIRELEPAQFKALIEALVFASDKPMTVVRLKQLTRTKETAKVEAVLAELQADYATRGVALQCISGGYMFRTQSAYSSWVQQLIAGRPVRLSRAQLETLAIIAYRQPITRPEIDDIRGVDSGGTLKVLLDRSLIRILGKKEEVGRPLLYGTTKEFLDFFSLNDLRELPTLREYSELSEEHRKVVDEQHGQDDDEEPPAGESAA